ncbi:kinase-related protein [Aspergillus undulatus]|uniref:kinase-related protein n=1 Tax=Aspergillus undulatus TaxID=1810928 RepID=UPI003CCDC9D6
MESQVTRLVGRVWGESQAHPRKHPQPLTESPKPEKFQNTPENARLLIAVSGIPGSGKTELAISMAKRINELYGAQNGGRLIATSIPMDGYHLTRAQLAQMPDPEMAAARRGAAFTFDGDKFLELVRALREPLTAQTQTLHAPSFDHAVKDPVDNDIPIAAERRVILFEGNYLSLNREPWSLAAKLMDELWFVDVDFDTARKRLIKRHVKAGIAKDEAEAEKRVDENDLVNGREIVDYRLDVQEIITSSYDPKWEY